MKQVISFSILMTLSLALTFCTSPASKMGAGETQPAHGQVILETFIGEQGPELKIDLLRWEYLQDSVIAISGKILSAENALLEGINVSLLDKNGKLLTKASWSNAAGTFTIASQNISVNDHLLFTHRDFKTLDLVIKELKDSSAGMRVNYERVILP